MTGDQHPDHNSAVMGMERECYACGHKSVPRPWTPGWTPYPQGWICPACARVERVF